jgi:hypothetical protein
MRSLRRPARTRAQDIARRVARIDQAAQGGAVLSEHTTTYPNGRVVKEVRYAAPDWRADAWHLERRYPEAWGRKEKHMLEWTIRRAAEKVAAEATAAGTPMTADEVLAEAQALLDEIDREGHPD